MTPQPESHSEICISDLILFHLIFWFSVPKKGEKEKVLVSSKESIIYLQDNCLSMQHTKIMAEITYMKGHR